MAKLKSVAKLDKYAAKRRFDKTPEPVGGEPDEQDELRFVVQKHQASRLHYDFRLEMDGVLKSWAVPKGPSMNPADKHLAMMVEDHPYDYRTFEGAIPKGNYGAGTVMVWDEGTYIERSALDQRISKADQEKQLRAGLHKGHLTVVLKGKKLNGEFALIKIKDSEDENAWLLVKKGDKFASTDDVTQQDRSAATGRSLDEINAAGDRQWTSEERPNLAKLMQGAPKQAFPSFVAPMLATLAKQSFDNPDWLYEVKWDGYRIVAVVQNRQVVLNSRNEQDYSERYRPVAGDLSGLGHDAVLDGEVVAVDEQGRSRFQLLQNYHKTGQGNLIYYMFDVLHLDGRDLTGLPLKQRKDILRAIMPSARHVKLSDHIVGQGQSFFELAKEQELEGIMAKNASSIYAPGRRSQDWLKVKTHQRQEAVIGGFTEPQGGRKHFGALVLGVYDHGELVYIGHSGGGFDDRNLKSLHERLLKLETKTCSFKTNPKTNTPAHWVKPELVCEVEFSEWTEDGHMRHPIFVGLREDKMAQAVAREKPSNEPRPASQAKVVAQSLKPKSMAKTISHERRVTQDGELVIAGNKLKLSHLDKVYWPDDGYSKGDLIDYYQRIASVIMPYLKDRPMSLNRHPGGITAQSFYQKDVEKHPDWVKTYAVRSESEDKDIHYLVCRSQADLIYMANLGCIEINPWSSRIKQPDKPDWGVIDLDPEDITFEEVVKVAQTTHKVLDSIGLTGYPKTSGATGIHIYVPMGGEYTYEQVKDFIHIVVQLVNAKYPNTTSLERSPAKRPNRIYLDYLQNRRGQTLAAPYSVRPRPGAPVSTPLKWEEVRRGLHPSQFTIKNIEQRLAKVGDLWQPVLGKGIDMQQALEAISALGKD